MRLLIVMMVLLISPNAFAFDVSDKPTVFIDLHVTSFHSRDTWFKEERSPVNPGETITTELPFNENNNGIGLRWPVADYFDTAIGVFKNSFNNTSFYAGGEVHTLRTRFVSLGFAAALVTGYGSDVSAPTPIIAIPVLQIGVPRIGIRLGYMPFGKVRFGTLSFYAGF